MWCTAANGSVYGMDIPTDQISQRPAEDPGGESIEVPSPEASIDVVIVTANTREMTLRCVKALGGTPDLNVVVVDNCSSDDTVQALDLLPGDGPQVIELDHPVGFASACNRGAERGGAPLVLFLNSDILAMPGSIGKLRQAIEEDPQAVASGGRLVDPETLETQPGYKPRRFPSLAGLVMILTGVEKLWPGNPISRRYHGSELDEESTQRVYQPAAAALMVRRDQLDAIGGFDERFWFWFEDSDLLRRLHDRGPILWVPSAPFRHVGGASFSSWDRVAQIRSLHHGMLHYSAVHFSVLDRILIGSLAIAVSLPRVVIMHRIRPQEAAAWRDVARAGRALIFGRPVPRIAPA